MSCVIKWIMDPKIFSCSWTTFCAEGVLSDSLTHQQRFLLIYDNAIFGRSLQEHKNTSDFIEPCLHRNHFFLYTVRRYKAPALKISSQCQLRPMHRALIVAVCIAYREYRYSEVWIHQLRKIFASGCCGWEGCAVGQRRHWSQVPTGIETFDPLAWWDEQIPLRNLNLSSMCALLLYVVLGLSCLCELNSLIVFSS